MDLLFLAAIIHLYVKKVFELLRDCRPVTGLFHEYELKLAQLVNRFMPAVEIFRMLGSGTESVMAAARAARAFTKKKYVIKVGAPITAGATRWCMGYMWARRLEAAGIPRGANSATEEFFPNSLESAATTFNS